MEAVVAADNRIVLAIDHDPREFELQFRAAGKVPGFLGFGQPPVNVRSLAGDHRVANGQVCFKAGVEDVAHVILGRIHTVDHPHQQGLSRRDGYRPARISIRHGCNRGRWRRWSWSRCWNSMTGIAGEGQRYKVGGIKSLNFPIDLKT